MIQGVLYLWYVLVFLSLIFLIYDLIYNTPAPGVMKIAWIIIIIYTGVIGLFIYLLSCRQPLAKMHARYIESHWKQAVGSLIHCVTGDATGIIFAAAITYFFHLPNGIDLIIEYLSGFIVGWFIFQALFMLPMLGGNYLLALRKTFFPELTSMNMVMLGMFPVMLVLIAFLPEGRSPLNLVFWGIVSLATIVGAVVTYPVNSWMVARGLKHGMMTVGEEHDSHPVQPSYRLTWWMAVLMGGGTFSLMVLGIYITSLFVPLNF